MYGITMSVELDHSKAEQEGPFGEYVWILSAATPEVLFI
jgi:hypothetical protein